jgi:hypothetical protein
VRQVGYLLELYRDAGSVKQKKRDVNIHIFRIKCVDEEVMSNIINMYIPDEAHTSI